MTMSGCTPILVVGVSAVLAPAPYASGDVYAYECDSLPTSAGWELLQAYCDPQEWVEDGYLFQRVEFCEGSNPPAGQQFDYGRSLDEFLGTEQFFIEWKLETDGDRSEIPWTAPTALSAWSIGPSRYLFVIAADQVKLNRDNRLPIIFIDIEPGVFHTFRLEIYGTDLYVWYIDGEVVDSGLPESEYPSHIPRLNIRAKSKFVDSTAIWDYIRYGEIPVEGSGDFDSEGDVDLRDFYFFDECLTNGGPGVDAGPGCLWADMDMDNDVDFHDLGLFQLAFTGSE
jgi:hypothetical protein